MIPIFKCNHETTSHIFRACKPGGIFLKLSNMSFLTLLFPAQLASSWEEHKVNWAKGVTWHRDDIITRTTVPNCSTSRVCLLVGFSFIPRESPSEPHQILVSTVASWRERPVQSQWSKCKWSGADTGNRHESRGCTSLHDQILTRKSQEVRNLSCPSNLAARPQAMRQDTKVQGRRCVTRAPGQLNHTEIWDGKDQTRSAAPFTRGQRKITVFPKISSLGQAASRGPKRVSVILGGNSSQPPDLKHYLTFRRWFPRSVVPLDFCVLTSWPMACPYPLAFAPLKCWFFIFRHFRILDQTINEPTNVSERYKSLRAENKVRGHRLSSQGPFWCVLAGWGHCYCP